MQSSSQCKSCQMGGGHKKQYALQTRRKTPQSLHEQEDSEGSEDIGGVEDVEEGGEEYEHNYGATRRYTPLANNMQEFTTGVRKMRKAKIPYYRPIDILQLKRTLCEAMIFPEMSKGVKFPSEFQIPTYCFQQKNSFTVSTNSLGNCLIQVNMGQFLDSTRYATGQGAGTAASPLLTVGGGANPTINGSAIIQNGTSLVGQSNVFICNHDTLTGTSPVVADGGVYKASNIMQVNSGTFNVVRAGPMSVKYEYIGRLDASQGNVTMGLNYTAVADPAGIAAGTSANGLYPDPNYSILSALEDCPFARTLPATDSVKAIFVPQDYTMLNLKSPIDAISTVMPQRLYIMVLAAPPSSTIGRITITSNWEAVPTKSFSDIISLNYSIYPSDFDAKAIYDYMVSNNLIITRDDSEFGLFKFLEQF